MWTEQTLICFEAVQLLKMVVSSTYSNMVFLLVCLHGSVGQEHLYMQISSKKSVCP